MHAMSQMMEGDKDKSGPQDFLGNSEEREFPVQLRKIRRLDGLSKRTDAPTDLSGLVSEISASTFQKAEQEGPIDPVELLAKLDNSDPSVQLESLEAIKGILAAGKPQEAIDAFLAGDLINKCIRLLRETEVPMVASNSLLILHWISYGDSNLTKSLLHAESLLPLLLDILKTSFSLSEKAILTLGNIAADSTYCRGVLLDNGIVGALEELSKKYLPKLYMRNYAWLISNLCRCKDLSPKFGEARKLIPIINKILTEQSDEETSFHCCIAVQRLTFDADKEKIQAVVDGGIVPPLVELVNVNFKKAMPIALRALGNISSGTEDHTDKLIEAKILRKIRTLLQIDDKDAMKHAVWILGNICADTPKHIQAAVDVAVFPHLYPILSNGTPDVQLEAATTLKNIIKYGSNNQLKNVVFDCALLGPFCRLLSSPSVEIVKTVLIGLGILLRRAEACGDVEDVRANIESYESLEKLESLQYHENEVINKNACFLMDKFFSDRADKN